MQQTINVRGIDFAYLELGPTDGPLALCLHGFPDHALTWELLLVELAEAGFHAVAPWTRGYAPTGLAPDGNYQVASLALDALALTDALAGDQKPVIIGHDWGAITAYTAVAHAPERFAKLVNIAVPHALALGEKIFTPEQLERSWYQFFFQLPFAPMVVPNDDYAVIDFLWRRWSPNYTAPEPFMRALKDTFSQPGSLEAAIAYYRFTFGSLEADPALADVQNAFVAPTPIPTLYFHGDHDGVLDISLAQEESMRPHFPAGLEFEIVKDAGHFLHLEEPEFVNRRIVDFLLR